MIFDEIKMLSTSHIVVDHGITSKILLCVYNNICFSNKLNPLPDPPHMRFRCI